MDAFYVSVERALNPSLAGKPVVVGGGPGERGVVASASYEAREVGIRAAMPLSQARRLCPRAVFIRGNYGQYEEYSHRLRRIFQNFSPLVEMASQDEAYIDLSGMGRLFGSPISVAERIRKRIREELSLPASFGLGANKLIAKVASVWAKPSGLLYVWRGYEEAFLAPMPLEKLPGIGSRIGERLSLYGLKTIGDLVRLGEGRLVKEFGQVGRVLYERACGRDDSPVIPMTPAKSVSRGETFAQDSYDVNFLGSVICHLSGKIGDALRATHCRTGCVTLLLRYSDFRIERRGTGLFEPTNYDVVISRTATGIFHKVWKRRMAVRSVTISASRLYYDRWQLDFLNSANFEKFRRLYCAIDNVRRRYGFQSLLAGEMLLYKRATLG